LIPFFGRLIERRS